MDWSTYEKITKYIYEALGKEAGVKIIGHGRNCKVKGKSDVEHQIDVLTSHSDGIHDYQTAIECKYWESRINKDIVMKVLAIIADTGISKGVIVSKNGFTDDGISFAKFNNIGLVELKELNDSAVIGKFNNEGELFATLQIKTELRRPEILKIVIEIVGANPKSEEMDTRQLIVRFNDGKEVLFDSYLTSFKNDLHKEEPDKIVQKYYELKDTTIINRTTEQMIQVKGLALSGKLTVKNDVLKWNIVDKVWLTMKSLFENKSYTISQMGVIKEDKENNRSTEVNK